MACFLVPVAEAVVTTIAKQIVKRNEKKTETVISGTNSFNKIKFSEKLGWLNKMLWGGSGLLAFEHLWHGEISPFFPFLTAASNPADTAEMFQEIATSGVGMAVLVTVVWGVMVISTSKIQKRATKLSAKEVIAE